MGRAVRRRRWKNAREERLGSRQDNKETRDEMKKEKEKEERKE